MHIRKLTIKNFRRFENLTIEFNDDNMIVLAGANNSGKTSLVQLLDGVFNRNSYADDKDISIEVRKKYVEEMLAELKKKKLNTPDDLIEHISTFMNDRNHSKNEEHLNYPIIIQIVVNYEKEEPLGFFANYLMDLDDDNQEFYFEFSIQANQSRLHKNFVSEKENIFKTFKEYEQSKDSTVFEDVIFTLIGNHFEKKIYYCDANFDLKNQIDNMHIKRMFNFEYISANRKLDDGEKEDKPITNSIINLNNPIDPNVDWNKEFKEVFKAINQAIIDKKIDKKMQENTENALQHIKDNLDEIQFYEFENIESNLLLNEESVLDLIRTDFELNYRYQTQTGEFALGENSQGLGVSNLIYIALKIQNYIREAQSNPQRVNFFVIEEPENHMHVQMQKIFISYLQDIFESEKSKGKKLYFQSMLTTHSTEIVKESKVDYLKVIRPLDDFKNFLVDLKTFIDNHEEDSNFYETLFRLNFSNIIFADYAILFEGDTERMYIEHLISRSGAFDVLAKQYIAFSQVGGAFAMKYFPLIDALRIKSVIFTDLDYIKNIGVPEKKASNSDEDTKDVILTEDELKEKVLESTSTNSTLNNLVEDGVEKSVENIFEALQSEANNNEYYKIFTQGEDEGYARTLEDAMLFQYYNSTHPEIESVFHKILKSDWNQIQRTSNFLFSTPNPSEASIRYVADKIGKSDFMYSVILNDKDHQCIPVYLREGLLWLEESKKTIT